MLVEEMDEEHEVCVAALNALGEQRSVESLEVLLHVCGKHFAHEEQLLDEHLYGQVSAGDGFSADAGARRSHFRDHEHILEQMRQGIEDAKNGGQISAQLVERLIHEFERHADEYDGSYAERLQMAMAA